MKIVLSGSGVLYPIHVGAIKRLLECGCITEICGTSGGAIIASIIASGLSNYEEIILNNLPADGLLDPSFKNLVNYGLMSGSKIEKMLKKYLKSNFGDTEIPLKVITCNLNTRKHVVFGTMETPKFSIPKAVRASMSIPGVFTPVKINKQIHVDGGVSANFPLDIYGTGKDVVGIRIQPSIYRESDISNVKDYLSSLLGTMMDSLANNSIDMAIGARTITIPTTYSSLNFLVSRNEAEEMINYGYKTVDKWLETNKVI